MARLKVVDPQPDDNLLSVSEWWAKELQSNFTVIPNVLLRCDLGLDVYAQRVLFTFMSWMVKSQPENWVRSRGRITIPNLHEWTGISRDKIMTAIVDLEAREYVITERKRGVPTRYRINITKVMEVAKYQCNLAADQWIEPE